MKRADFKVVFDRLNTEKGKEYFESVVQYAGYWLLQLTEKQGKKLATFLHTTFNYPVTVRDNNTWVICPNGMQLLMKGE